LGFGLYDEAGLIGIRVMRRGEAPPDTAWWAERLKKALAKRIPLRNYTDAFRLLHGENDGVPGVVIDVYGTTAVLQTYAASVDAVGRYLASLAAKELNLATVIWKPPSKRKSTEVRKSRILRGVPPGIVDIREGKLQLHVDPWEGQKSGAFLDLRGLRKFIATQPLKNKRVLNTFAYTGTLGLAAETAGAKEIWNVDISDGALAAAKKYHALDKTKHRWITADVFDWLEKLGPKEMFDLIILDPPQMAATSQQVPGALRSYRKLFQLALPHLIPGGTLIGCCCTSRISRADFKLSIDQAVSKRLSLKQSLAAEDDHPVGFDEGDYLKMLVYR
jgi:23S rRNA (cytosine1962-C5)-methyltransferase